MTASIYLKRAGLNVLLLEKNVPGGQINMSSKIENYPGIISIDGPTLAMNIFNQIQELKIDYKYGNVLEIIDNGSLKTVKTDIESYQTKKILIATGRTPKKLNLEDENKLIGRGISYCALCDGNFYKNKDIAVIGGGNSALEEAIYLSNICKKVYLIHRRDQFKAEAILQERLKEKNNIEIIYNEEIQKINTKEDRLVSINLKNTRLEIAGLFIYIGYEPDTKFTNKLNINKENDYLLVDNNSMTNIDGIYACGDVIKKQVYQISTAIGEGANAASNIIKSLQM